ncbi:dTDP-4-dehydrorhamnose reductase [Flavobacteriales bacterium 33_180_T64]|nr:dTDP-4-dehydrorhamnose reductase [Flavobacteriales bacterium 33_180_T64]
MINILVTGGNGQLAKCISDLESKTSNLNVIYTDYLELDITNLEDVNAFYNRNTFDYCINCAAYTAVDNAENDEINAAKVNELGAKNLAIACRNNNVILIHISTDFVFDGNKSSAYNEEDTTNPTGIYGITKLKGEQAIINHLESYFIIRTAWLYSEHGNNFLKTMIRLSKDRTELSVVVDQIGTPTYATDLAATILKVINSKSQEFGVYHYSNEGVASWYDFAKAIFDENKSQISLSPINTEDYPTPAKRPYFSVLDKSKIKSNFDIEIPHWRDSLRIAIKRQYE